MKIPARLTEEKTLTAAALVLSLAGFAVLVRRYFGFSIDDSYISYQYARNVALGHGFSFNPGEIIEGYTNFLLIVILAFFRKIGFDHTVVSQYLSIASGIICLFLAWAIARKTMRNRFLVLAVPISLSINMVFVLWSVSGMETILYSMWVTAAVFCALLFLENKTEYLPLTMVLLTMAVLTRPDGILYALCLALFLLREEGEWRWQRIYSYIFYLGIPILIYLVWKYFYFGDILPNTYHVKTGGGIRQLVRGINYLGDFLQNSWYLFYLLPLILLLRFKQLSRPQRLLTVMLLAGILFPFYSGGDFAQFWRFICPVIPLWTIASFLALDELLNLPSPSAVLQKGVVVLVGVICFLTLAGQNLRRKNTLLIGGSVFVVKVRNAAGSWLKANTPPHFKIALVCLGSISFYSERYSVDVLGLIDSYIAHKTVKNMGSGSPGHEKFDAAYILSRKPDIIIINSQPMTSWEHVRSFMKDRPYLLDFLNQKEKLFGHYEFRSVNYFHDYYLNYFQRVEPG